MVWKDDAFTVTQMTGLIQDGQRLSRSRHAILTPGLRPVCGHDPNSVLEVHLVPACRANHNRPLGGENLKLERKLGRRWRIGCTNRAKHFGHITVRKYHRKPLW